MPTSSSIVMEIVTSSYILFLTHDGNQNRHTGVLVERKVLSCLLKVQRTFHNVPGKVYFHYNRKEKSVIISEIHRPGPWISGISSSSASKLGSLLAELLRRPSTLVIVSGSSSMSTMGKWVLSPGKEAAM
jgi:hypothetical protein